MDGWDGMDGTEYQKCPLIFFILCGYIDKVYTYLNIIYSKIVTNIHMDFKILCQVGGRDRKIQNYDR